ncbi:MAG: hypothetical protein LBM02_04070 [Lachnospiraceae bacterium]|nr:hypothetical protein [Lachnospiraceae bacterium]
MVKVELSYNPYLLETNVKFNGEAPKINSVVNKYSSKKLQSWITQLPRIFHDEMNGYDFDLEFTGTNADFTDLQQSFLQAGVSLESDHTKGGQTIPADIRLILVNEIESSLTKYNKVHSLLNWLKKIPNRQFDEAKFRENHSEIFEEPYNLLVMGTENTEIKKNSDLSITVEAANSIEEIPDELADTPILLYIENKNKTIIIEFIDYLLTREDVDENQMFFLLHPELNQQKTIRFIQDKGIICPKILQSTDDWQLKEYLETNPMVTSIANSIKVFRCEILNIRQVLRFENERVRIQNEDVHNQIDDLEKLISLLKEVNEKFIQRDIWQIPEIFIDIQKELNRRILNWKKKKNKYSSDEEAKRGAIEYSSDINGQCKKFNEILDAEFKEQLTKIKKDFTLLYDSSGANDNFTIDVETNFKDDIEDVENLSVKFLENRKTRMVEQDLIGKAISLFDNRSTDELVEEVTYSIENWRDLALQVVNDFSDKRIRELNSYLSDYYNQLAEIYHEHLEEMIAQTVATKNEIAGQLSYEEQKLNEDNDWLNAFDDKVKVIEERVE